MKIIAIVGIFLALLLSSVAFAKVGGGDIVFEVKKGKVTFSHDSHVKSAGFACQECHDKPYLSVSQHRKVSMKEMEKGKSCGTCHNGKKAFSVKENCQNCHKK
jgi:c(7)-type cytochrome triheme protein